jgi:predicted MPP superfamily phosphohydrolase
MPKKFILILILIQIILSLGHWLLYSALLFFFPQIIPSSSLLLWGILLASVSFLVFSVLSIKINSRIIGVLSIVSSIEVLAWFYLLCAAGVSSVLYIVAGGQPFKIVPAIIFSLAICYTLYGIINPRILRTVTVPISMPNLPTEWKNKTAVVVSDLHLGHVLKQGFAKKIISRINDLNPDIVFIPGDFFDSVKMDFKETAGWFKEVKAPLGIYYCSGNHELYVGMHECEQALSGAGIHVLDDGKMEVNGMQIAGIGYDHERMTDLAERLSKLEIDKNKPSILLKHVPLQLDIAANAGINLQLSGHTHRGQVWPGSLITKRYYSGYDYGFKKYNDMLVYISSGAGTWGPPMRTGSRSEIVQIIFT